MSKKKILVTGVAGFIGMHLAKELLQRGFQVVGIDNLNNYYNVNLKFDRLKELGINRNEVKENIELAGVKNFSFIKLDLLNREELAKLFAKNNFRHVINLAAQAGVRYSISHPSTYIDSNIIGFFNLIEECKKHKKITLFFASSSSVYGGSDDIPFKVSSDTNKPVSLYAATKKTNELFAYAYSHLFNMRVVGLRFFTVYGPFGRPDMAYFIFADKINNRRPITLFNHGNLSRDFTYIDDVVESIVRLILFDKKSKRSNFQIYNIGNQTPVAIKSFVRIIGELLNKEVRIINSKMQPGDVKCTFADTSELVNQISYSPSTPLKTGLREFITWYLAYSAKD